MRAESHQGASQPIEGNAAERGHHQIKHPCRPANAIGERGGRRGSLEGRQIGPGVRDCLLQPCPVLCHVAPRRFDFLLVLVRLRLQEQPAVRSAAALGALGDNRSVGGGLALHGCLEAGGSLWKRRNGGLCLRNPRLEFLPRFHGLPERCLRSLARGRQAFGRAEEGEDLAGSDASDQEDCNALPPLFSPRPASGDGCHRNAGRHAQRDVGV